MNMYDMIKKMHYNQSFDEQDILHRRSSWFDDDDDVGNRRQRRRRRRRRSSLTGYELNYFKDKSLPKSTTTTDQLFISNKSNQFQRQSTIHRINSSTSND
jgi:hypothetical protein